MRGRTLAAPAALALAAFAFVTAETLPIGLLAPIARSLDTATAAIGLLVTGYAAVVVAATIPLTRWTRRVPRRPLLLLLLAVLVAGSALGSAVRSYAALLVLRLVVALAQALFWAIVIPVVASVVRAPARGRAVAVVNAGSALGPVIGVPAATWIGQAAGWRIAFLGLALLGVVALVVLALSLPAASAADPVVQRGTQPDRLRFCVTVVVTGLAVTGAYAAFTYVTPYLAGVAHVPPESDGVVLLLRGLAGFAGAVLAGLLVDRAPWRALLVVTVLQSVALVAQWSGTGIPALAVTAVVVTGLSLSALATVNGGRLLRYAPADTAAASAIVSTAFNAGIMLGALLGSAVVTTIGVVAVPLLGAAATLAAVAVVLAEPVVGRAVARRGVTVPRLPARR